MLHWTDQCFGSVLISIQIRIQHFRPIRIRIRIHDFSWPKCQKFFFWKIKILFFVTNCFKNIDGGLPGFSKNHQTFCKMVIALFNLKSQIFFPFWTPFWQSWIYTGTLCFRDDSFRGPGVPENLCGHILFQNVPSTHQNTFLFILKSLWTIARIHQKKLISFWNIFLLRTVWTVCIPRDAVWAPSESSSSRAYQQFSRKESFDQMSACRDASFF